MNVEEKNKFDRMEQHIKEIQKDISNILSALVGNVANGNNGLIHEMQNMKEKQGEFERELISIRQELIKSNSINNILKWILTGVTTLSISVISYFIINNIFK